MSTSDIITRRAHCGGCGGPSGGRSMFEIALAPNGKALPVWVCVNCGHQHRMRGHWVALHKKLRGTTLQPHRKLEQA